MDWWRGLLRASEPIVDHGDWDLSASPTIYLTDRFAHAANLGRIDFRTHAANGVGVGESFLSGFVYAASFGWIHRGDGSPVNGRPLLECFVHRLWREPHARGGAQRSCLLAEHRLDRLRATLRPALMHGENPFAIL